MIRLEGVGKDYVEGGRLHTVLDGVDAAIEAGESVAIRGPSGSGKTTLLNLMAGIDRPSRGEITIADTALSRLDERELTILRRERIGFIFQFFNLIPTLTAIENVRLPAELDGAGGEALPLRARELLGRVGLEGRADSFPDRLSGGEQQRVGIARALVRDPEIVLADEPTGNLDAASGAEVLELLQDLVGGSRRTLVIVTHSELVAGRADRTLTLERGRLEQGVQSPELARQTGVRGID